MSEDLLEVFRDILAEPSVEAYEQVLEILLEEFFAERGCMWLERENRFVYRGDEELRRTFPFSRRAVDEVLEQGVSFISLDATTDERFRPSGSVMLHNVRSCLCAASRNAEGEVLVLAYFDNSMTSGPFAEKDLEMLKDVLSLVPGAVPLVA